MREIRNKLQVFLGSADDSDFRSGFLLIL